MFFWPWRLDAHCLCDSPEKEKIFFRRGGWQKEFDCADDD